MSLKYIIEFKAYTDGDWGYGENILSNDYTSKYIENRLFEYTDKDPDCYSSKFRRVFDTKNELLAFIESLSTSIHGNEHWSYTVRELFRNATDALKSYAKTQPKTIFSDFIDSNTEADISIYTAEYNDPRDKGARLVSAMILDPVRFDRIIAAVYPDDETSVDYSMDGLSVTLNDDMMPGYKDLYARLADYFGVKTVTYIHLDMTSEAEVWISYTV